MGGGFIVVCRCGSMCNQIKVHTRGCRKGVKTGWQVVRPWKGSYHNWPWPLSRWWGVRVVRSKRGFGLPGDCSEMSLPSYPHTAHSQ